MKLSVRKAGVGLGAAAIIGFGTFAGVSSNQHGGSKSGRADVKQTVVRAPVLTVELTLPRSPRAQLMAATHTAAGHKEAVAASQARSTPKLVIPKHALRLSLIRSDFARAGVETDVKMTTVSDLLTDLADIGVPYYPPTKGSSELSALGPDGVIDAVMQSGSLQPEADVQGPVEGWEIELVDPTSGDTLAIVGSSSHGTSPSFWTSLPTVGG